MVRDLSTNGTFVDGRRVMGAQSLPFGKPISSGRSRCAFAPGSPAPGPCPRARRGRGEEAAAAAAAPAPVEQLERAAQDHRRRRAPVRLGRAAAAEEAEVVPVVVMPRASAPPVVVAKPGGPVMPLKAELAERARHAVAATAHHDDDALGERTGRVAHGGGVGPERSSIVTPYLCSAALSGGIPNEPKLSPSSPFTPRKSQSSLTSLLLLICKFHPSGSRR